MNQNVVFASRISDRWTFAIEFEGIGNPPKLWNEWWGSLWLWVDGQVVGCPSEIEMVMIGLGSLLESAQQIPIGTSSPLQPSIPAVEALDLVMRASYGDDDRAPGEFVGDPLDLAQHEVLPRLTGPFFDGWEAVLIVVGQEERFIFRQEGAEAREVLWPAGTFRSTVQKAIDELKRLSGRWPASEYS